MKAIILCAGYGTRLGDLTKSLPKPMLPIRNKPLLEYTIRYLAHQGIVDIAINLHFLPQIITEYFKDGKAYGVKLQYFYEETLLGTAGAVKNMSEWLSEANDFYVIYGDILINQDLRKLKKFHQQKGGLATLLLHHRLASNSLVKMNNNKRITDFIERPSETQRKASPYPWVNSGVCMLNERILNFIPSTIPADLPKDVFTKIFHNNPIYGFPLSGYRCAIDSPARYEEANKAIAHGQYKSHPVTENEVT